VSDSAIRPPTRRPPVWARALGLLTPAKFEATRRAYASAGIAASCALENVEFVWRYYGRLALLLWSPYRRRLQRNACARGTGRLSRALAGGRGSAVIVSCHLGEMELAGSWLTECTGREVVAVVDEVTPRVRQVFFDSVRGACGIVLRRQADTSLMELCRDLDAGRIVLLMLDRRSTSPSVPTSFMGRRTLLSLVPWLLAVRAEAPVLAAWTQRSPGGGTTLHFGAPSTARECRALGARATIQRLASDLELAIFAAPSQWHIPADLAQLPRVVGAESGWSALPRPVVTVR
jgi:lauroyl/myristoyl acyltransferase